MAVGVLNFVFGKSFSPPSHTDTEKIFGALLQLLTCIRESCHAPPTSLSL
jgi:hypothetical protein